MHFKTFVNGVLVGILLGVLFAPDSGEQTRKKITRRAQGIKDSYDDFAGDVSNTYRKVKDKASDFVNLAKDKINNAQEETETMYDV
ncbi:MAG: YtxH domain-containing protein [Parafilimonas sp.]